MKRLSRLLALCLTAACLSACGGSGKPDNPAGEPEEDARVEEAVEDTTAEDNAVEDSASADAVVFDGLKSFTADTLDGGTFTAADFADADLTVVNIWATWCGPCLGEMPELAAFAKTLPDNVRLMTLCTDGPDAAEQASEILADAGYDGVTLVTVDGDFATLLGAVMYIPTTIFVDAAGNLIGEAVVGAQTPLDAVYTEHINDALTALGKQALP